MFVRPKMLCLDKSFSMFNIAISFANEFVLNHFFRSFIHSIFQISSPAVRQWSQVCVLLMGQWDVLVMPHHWWSRSWISSFIWANRISMLFFAVHYFLFHSLSNRFSVHQIGLYIFHHIHFILQKAYRLLHTFFLVRNVYYFFSLNIILLSNV